MPDKEDEEQVKSADLLTHVLKIPAGRQTQGDSMKLATVMKLLGWEKPKKKLVFDNEQWRGYTRKKIIQTKTDKSVEYPTTDDEIPF